jgi:cytochrome d ubiquinol oxidase subunit II
MAAMMGRRASVAGAITGAVALAAVLVLEFDAESLASGLHGRGAALIVVSAVAGLFSLWQLRAGRWAAARIGAVVAVAAVVIGWGVGQYPDLLVDELTIADAAGARSTLIGLIIVFGLASVTAVPSLLWLFWLVNRPDWAPTEHTPSAESG